MTAKILLTSFATWLPHQKTNSSDDLLDKLAQIHPPSPEITYLRQLPVDFHLAPHQVIEKIPQIQPDIIICCGMAESRQNLTIESRATQGENILKTKINLDKLIADLPTTTISHDAGKFVCEALYYGVLKYIQDTKLSADCIFVHVPILTPANEAPILSEFLEIIHRVGLISTKNMGQ